MKKKIIALFALALACVCMWGCGLLDDEERFVVDKNRTNGYLVAIIDDSLAIMQNRRGWELWDDDCNSWEYCDKGTMNPGIFLVNYRKKQSPLWGDTVEGRISVVDGYFHDSSALFSNIDGEFGFWRIGEKPRVVRKWNCEAPCECNYEKYGRPWMYGNVLLNMEWNKECPYAILDTATGNVTKLEFTGDYAWLEGCDDITYIDEEIICLKRLAGAMGAVSLLTSKGVIDSLENTKERDFLGYPPILYGNFMLVQVYRKDLLGIRIMLKVNKNGFGFSYPEMWMSSNVFVDSSGISVGYSFEDLVVTR
jgi:hypothetical protein